MVFHHAAEKAGPRQRTTLASACLHSRLSHCGASVASVLGDTVIGRLSSVVQSSVGVGRSSSFVGRRSSVGGRRSAVVSRRPVGPRKSSTRST